MRQLLQKIGIWWPRRGATSWEWQIGPLYGYWPKWDFWKCGCRPTVGWDKEYWEDG